MSGLAIDFDDGFLYFSVERESNVNSQNPFGKSLSNGIISVPLTLDKPNAVFSDAQTEQVGNNFGRWQSVKILNIQIRICLFAKPFML